MLLLDAFEEYISEFELLRNGKSGPAYRDALHTLLRDTSIVNINELTVPTFKKWVLAMEERGNVSATVTNNLKRVAGFCKWLFKRRLLEDNPFDYIHRQEEPSIPRAMHWSEAQKIVDTLHGKRLSKRDHAFVNFLLHTGARASEALSLTIDKIDTTEHKVYFTNTKSRRPRTIYFGPKFKKSFYDYLNWRRVKWPTSLYVFPSRSGKRLAYHVVADMAKEMGFRLHDMRHTFATESLRQTNSLRTVQILMGHSKPETTAKYALVWDEGLKDAAFALEGDGVQRVDKKGKVIR